MTVEPTRSKRRFIGMSDGMYKNKTRQKARLFVGSLAGQNIPHHKPPKFLKGT